MKKLLGRRCGTGTSGSDYLMQTKGSDLGPKAGPDLRGLDEPSPEANAFLPATDLQFATTSATRSENCCSELSFTPGLHFSLQSTVSPQKGFPAPQLFDAAPYLPSVYPAAAHSVD